MERLGVAEAKRRFSELLDRVARGEHFIVERRGKPVVALVPPSEKTMKEPQEKLGFLSMLGLLDDWAQEEVEEMVRHIYRERRRAKDRPPPSFD